MSIIANQYKRLKEWAINHRRELILLTIIFLSSTISFALGYLMANDQNRAPIIIEKAD